MFGSNLLVAPMLEEGSGRDVYLPGRQKWIDYQTGKVYAPGWNHIECGTLPIIILVKDGSAIPHIPVAQCTDQMKWDKITWKKYLADEKKAEGCSVCRRTDGCNECPSHNPLSFHVRDAHLKLHEIYISYIMRCTSRADKRYRLR